MDTLLPASVEAEEALLGSLLIEPEAIVQVGEYLHPADFGARDAHRVIYQAITDLYRQRRPADLITLVDELTRQGKLAEVGGISTVTQLANDVPTSAHVDHYGRIVHRYAVQRHLIRYANDVAMLGYQAQDLDDALDRAREGWQAVEAHAEGVSASQQLDAAPASVALDELLGEVLARMEGQRRGIQTGYLDLDAHLISIEPTELCYLCGRPGMGKSALVQGLIQHNVAAFEALGEGSVYWATLEMSGVEVMNRVVCAHASVNTQLRRAGFKRPDGTIARAAYERWRQAYDEYYPMYHQRLLVQDTSCTVTQLRTRLSRAVDKHGCKLAVVDYVGLLKAEDRRASRYDTITDVSVELKAIARDLRIPIVGLVQMNRAAEARDNKRPTMGDLRETGQLEQDASFILGCYRPGYYDKARAAGDETFKRFTEVLVVKAREGVDDQTMIPLRAELEYARFGTWPRNVPWPDDPSRAMTEEDAAGPVSDNDERWWTHGE